MFKSIALNLPVKDVRNSADFFIKIGFREIPRFSNEIDTRAFKINSQIYLILLNREKFSTFIDNKISDLTNTTSNIIAVEFDTIEEVDKIFNNAIGLGAHEYKPVLEYNDTEGKLLMYTRSFKDIDNHAWEIYWIRENYIE